MKTGEWALENSEGVVEDGFWSREEAEAAMFRYDEEDELVAVELEFDDETEDDDEEGEGDDE